jgi:hypothetical protein
MEALMHNKLTVIGVALLAVVLWAGLILFMNQRPPNDANKALFLPLWGATVVCTIIPLAYLINEKIAASWNRRGSLGNSTRQGALVGILAMTLMLLRFTRLLNWTTAIILTLGIILVEVLIYVRART